MNYKFQKLLTLSGWAALLLASLSCVPPPIQRPGSVPYPPLGGDPVSPLSNPDRQFPNQQGKVNALAFDPTGRWIITGHDDGELKLWEFSSEQVVWRASAHNSAVLSTAFRGDGKVVASAVKNGSILFWDAATGHELLTFRSKQGEVRSIAFSPDNSLLATTGTDHTIKLWNASSGVELRALRGHTDAVNAAIFSPDGKTLATASSDKTVRLWNPVTGDCLAVFSGHNELVDTLAFRPDGLQLASGSAALTPLAHRGEYKFWDIRTRSQLAEPSPHYAVVTLAYRPDGRVLAIAYQRDRNFWNIDFFSFDEGRVVRHFVAHRKGISAIAFSPDGRWLVSAGSDGGIRCWH
jgi:WD40 repeat protein